MTLYFEYGATQDEHIRDQVIASCTSSKLRRKLLSETTLTLEKCLELGIAMENASRHAKEIEADLPKQTAEHETQETNFIKERKTSHRYQPSTRKPQQFPQRYNKPNYQGTQVKPSYQNTQKKCGRCAASGHLSYECRRSRGKICGKCGKKGHFQQACRTKSDQPSYQQRDRQHVHNTEHQSDSSDSTEEVYVFKLNSKGQEVHKIKINETKIDILIDSGSTSNIINSSTFKEILPKPQLTPTETKIYPYQSNSPLQLKGRFTATVQANGKTVSATFYIVQGKGKAILGRQTAEILDILRVGPLPPLDINQNMSNDIPESTQQILDKHLGTFKGIGKLKDFELTLHIDPNIVPVQQPIRRVPFHTREKISAEIKD